METQDLENCMAEDAGAESEAHTQAAYHDVNDTT